MTHPEISPEQAVAAIAALRNGALTVVTMQAMPPWIDAGQADQRNINLLGSMGSAASIGLGLALGRPNERVLVLDGDGSLAMQLGSLLTVAEHQPQNFYHLVFENGVYETSGGQVVPASSRADICRVALSCGYKGAVRISRSEELMSALEQAFSSAGPVLVAIGVTLRDRTVTPGRPARGFADDLVALRDELIGSERQEAVAP